MSLTGTPGHNDILGNEKIDTLAKMGAEGSKRAVAYSKYYQRLSKIYRYKNKGNGL